MPHCSIRASLRDMSCQLNVSSFAPSVVSTLSHAPVRTIYVACVPSPAHTHARTRHKHEHEHEHTRAHASRARDSVDQQSQHIRSLFSAGYPRDSVSQAHRLSVAPAASPISMSSLNVSGSLSVAESWCGPANRIIIRMHPWHQLAEATHSSLYKCDTRAG